MTKSRAERKAELMRVAETRIEAMLDWIEETETPNLEQIEEEVLRLHQKAGEQMAQGVLGGEAARRLVWTELLADRIIFTKKLASIQIQRQITEFNILREISKTLVETFDDDQILQLILDKALELTAANVGLIRLVHADHLEIKVSRIPPNVTVDQNWTKISLDIENKEISSRVAKDKQLIIVKNLNQEPSYLSYFQGMRSEIAIPLLKNHEIIGVLVLESPQEAAFDERDSRILSIFADLAVLAIQNTKRYHKLQEVNDALQRRQEHRVAEKQTVMISNFATNIAHRMGNDSGMILARAKELSRKLTPQISEYDYFNNSLDKIIDTLNKLGSWSERMREPIQPEKLEVVDVHQLLNNTLNELESFNHTHIIKDYSSIQLRTKSSINQLIEVFRVVFYNAIDAIAGEGVLTVNTKFIKDERGEWIEILISDTGKGMRPEEQANLFGLFYTTKRGKGMGYGLWWARSFLIESGGDIKLLRSEVGKGSMFQIILPSDYAV